ncbi:hypothetical protein Pelo_14039 [Pelomyxa schiedti]|nr:hypothetical protein Pelo_14039 [Pelomyxa schiedti]
MATRKLSGNAAPCVTKEESFHALMLGDYEADKEQLWSTWTGLMRSDDTAKVDTLKLAELAVEMSSRSRIEHVGERCVRIVIHQPQGQERFRFLTGSYFHKCFAIVYIYSIKHRETFSNLTMWIRNSATYLNLQDICKVIVGNHCHTKRRTVSFEEGRAFSKSEHMDFFEVSSKTGKNVDLVMHHIATSYFSFNSHQSATVPSGSKILLNSHTSLPNQPQPQQQMTPTTQAQSLMKKQILDALLAGKAADVDRNLRSKELSTLDFSHMQLHTLPEALASVTEVRTLDLSGNNFESFPTWLATMPLKDVKWLGNPLTGFPKDIPNKQWKAMKKHLEMVRMSASNWQSHRIIFLGGHKAGTSTVVNSLSRALGRSNRISKTEAEIPLLSITTVQQLYSDTTSFSPATTVFLWDFTGDPEYLNVLPYFLPHGSNTFVIVFNAEKKDFSWVDYLMNWVLCLTDASDISPLLLIGTHADSDVENDAMSNIAHAKHRYPKALYAGLRDVIPTGNGRITELRDAIFNILKGNKVIPESWVFFAEYLRNRSMSTPLTTAPTFLAWAVDCGIEPGKAWQLRRFMSEMGLILILREKIVINIGWLAQWFDWLREATENRATGHCGLSSKPDWNIICEVLEAISFGYPTRNSSNIVEQFLCPTLMSQELSGMTEGWWSAIPNATVEITHVFELQHLPPNAGTELLSATMSIPGVQRLSVWKNAVLLLLGHEIAFVFFSLSQNSTTVSVRMPPHTATTVSQLSPRQAQNTLLSQVLAMQSTCSVVHAGVLQPLSRHLILCPSCHLCQFTQRECVRGARDGWGWIKCRKTGIHMCARLLLPDAAHSEEALPVFGKKERSVSPDSSDLNSKNEPNTASETTVSSSTKNPIIQELPELSGFQQHSFDSIPRDSIDVFFTKLALLRGFKGLLQIKGISEATCSVYTEPGGLLLHDFLTHDGVTLEEKMMISRNLCSILKELHTAVPPLFHGRVHSQNIWINHTGSNITCKLGIPYFPGLHDSFSQGPFWMSPNPSPSDTSPVSSKAGFSASELIQPTWANKYAAFWTEEFDVFCFLLLLWEMYVPNVAKSNVELTQLTKSLTEDCPPAIIELVKTAENPTFSRPLLKTIVEILNSTTSAQVTEKELDASATYVLSYSPNEVTSPLVVSTTISQTNPLFAIWCCNKLWVAFESGLLNTYTLSKSGFSLVSTLEVDQVRCGAPADTSVLCGTSDGCLVIIDALTHTMVERFIASNTRTAVICMYSGTSASPSGASLLPSILASEGSSIKRSSALVWIGFADGKICAWDGHTLERSASLSIQPTSIFCDEDILVIGLSNNDVVELNPQTLEVVYRWVPHLSGATTSLARIPEMNLLCTASAIGSVRAWELEKPTNGTHSGYVTGRCTAFFPNAHGDQVNSMVSVNFPGSNFPEQLWSASSDKSIAVWNCKSMKRLQCISGRTKTATHPGGVSITAAPGLAGGPVVSVVKAGPHLISVSASAPPPQSTPENALNSTTTLSAWQPVPYTPAPRTSPPPPGSVLPPPPPLPIPTMPAPRPPPTASPPSTPPSETTIPEGVSAFFNFFFNPGNS